MKPKVLSRRTVLRGFGTALALPFLDAMLPAAGSMRPAAKTRRLLYLYVPNGIHMPAWTPSELGSSFALPPLLQPLSPFRNKFSVLSGLTHDKARANGDGPGDHARAAAVFLTGIQPLKTEGKVRLGRSADQVVAVQIGDRTRFRSLQLGCEPGILAGQCDSGYACAYSGHISWFSETTPASKETHPRKIFDRLFRGGQDAEAWAAQAERRQRRRSLLDYVHEEAGRLRRQLGHEDRRKMEEYLEGVRELERRMDFADRELAEAVGEEHRPSGIPVKFGDYLETMADLLVLALRSDATRVATWMFANEGSNRTYPELDIRDGHHSLSHHGKDKEKQAKIQRINQLHLEKFAYFLAAMEAAKDSQGSLLDQSMIVFGSAIADGNRHNHDNLPVLLAGGGCGSFQHGRHLRFPKETPLNNLHMSLLEAMGVPQEEFGDGKGPLLKLAQSIGGNF
ncbi:MAG: DUF1552 domain-containing protein [Planctomycetota bacterium]|nr:MAG: DUF1552 domain-containing protein [Planctomycetota bacterium]